MLGNSLGNFDSLSEHLYPKNGQAFDPGKQEFVPVQESAVDNARRLPNRVKTTVEAWQEYQKLFPKLDMKKIPIALDEWLAGYRGGAARSPMFGALTSAEALHEIFRNSEWFVISAYTHLTGLVNGRGETTILPVGRMFELYRGHFGTIPVAVTGNRPQQEVKGMVNVDKPKVSSGSATYPLDVAAAFTADRKTLTVAIVNPSEADQQIEAIFTGVSLQPSGKLLRIAAPESAAGMGAVVNIAETPLTETPAKMTIPKQSINLYELPVR
jgi:alpha-N-arabinofuranosidase